MSESDGEAPRSAAEAAEATAALGEEAVLNAAVAFAGHVASAAQQAAQQATSSAAESVGDAVYRQYLLETATLCLRRLADSYAATAADPEQGAIAALVQDGATRAREAMVTVEALGDLSLDLLDRLLGAA